MCNESFWLLSRMSSIKSNQSYLIRYPFRQFVWVWRFRSMSVHRWAECIYSTILVRYWTKKFPFYLIWRWILMLCSLARVGKDEILMPTTRLVENKFKHVAGVLVGHADHNPETRMIPTAEWVAKETLFELFKYLSKISSRNMLGLSFGICIPKSCTPEKVTRLFKTVQKWIFLNRIDISLVPDTCQVKDDLGWNLNAGDYACM